MTKTLEKILSYPGNQRFLKFFDVDKSINQTLAPVSEMDFFTHEGLEDFLRFEVPKESKYIFNNHGIIIMPKTCEVIAFQFGQFEVAFKVQEPNRYRKNFKHIKRGLLRNLKFKCANRVSLGYFSNIYADAETIMDIRELGQDWALSIYFVGQTEEMVKKFYNQRVNS